ncbi:MAG TPA: hypothetical protein VK211_20905 [Kamptonema sp.]|nr:hypothetical protein [Kamptonema sp.]
MPELLRCIECSAPVSLDDDRECPHCHTEYPRGVVCLGCFETLKQSEAVKHQTSSSHSAKYFHASCYHKVIQPQIVDPGSSRENFDPHSTGKVYDQKSLDELVRADAKRAHKEDRRKRAERRAKVISKTLRFLLLGTIGFIFWGVILSLMFGEIGLVIAFVVTVLLTVEIMKEM